MSKSVKIPSTMNPNWICEINGKTYSYLSGSTQIVPDEVASVIANIELMRPKENPVDFWKGMPYATKSDIGGVKQGVAVNDAVGDTPTNEEFKALLDSLRNAGVISK